MRLSSFITGVTNTVNALRAVRVSSLTQEAKLRQFFVERGSAKQQARHQAFNRKQAVRFAGEVTLVEKKALVTRKVRAQSSLSSLGS